MHSSFVHRFFVAGAPHVQRRLEGAGWRATTRWDWDLYWRPQVPSLAAYASLRPGVRVNHIPGIGALTSPRLLPQTLASTAAEILWTEPGSAMAPSHATSRFVLIAGVDPLRVYVHAVASDRNLAQFRAMWARARSRCRASPHVP